MGAKKVMFSLDVSAYDEWEDTELGLDRNYSLSRFVEESGRERWSIFLDEQLRDIAKLRSAGRRVSD
jgi:hypothetical protein